VLGCGVDEVIGLVDGEAAGVVDAREGEEGGFLEEVGERGGGRSRPGQQQGGDGEEGDEEGAGGAEAGG